MTQIMCDPPGGWKYGFPKQLPDHMAVTLSKQPTDDANTFGKTVMDWLVDQGYPQNEIDRYGDHFWMRYWQVEPR